MLCRPASRSAAVAVVLLVAVACGSPGPGSQRASSPASTAGPTATIPPASPGSSAQPASAPASSPVELTVREYDVPAGSHPHDVSPAADGGVWYTGQHVGVLGHLDPATGTIREIPLGAGSSPHGVITGPDGAAWVTDSGLDAIVRVDPATDQVQSFPLPSGRPNANLNTAVFDPSGHALVHRAGGRLWAAGSGDWRADGLRCP